MAVFHGDNKDKQMMFNVKDLEKICSKEKGVTQQVRGARSSCRAPARGASLQLAHVHLKLSARRTRTRSS